MKLLLLLFFFFIIIFYFLFFLIITYLIGNRDAKKQNSLSGSAILDFPLFFNQVRKSPSQNEKWLTV